MGLNHDFMGGSVRGPASFQNPQRDEWGNVLAQRAQRVQGPYTILTEQHKREFRAKLRFKEVRWSNIIDFRNANLDRIAEMANVVVNIGYESLKDVPEENYNELLTRWRRAIRASR